MKPSLQPGLAVTRRFTVEPIKTVGFIGQGARVYATPALVWDMEATCREMLLDHLDAGEDTVGARVELDHLAPTPLGLEVEIAATVAEVKGRRVSFDVTARDRFDEIGRCRHVRFVIDVAKTLERVQAKAAKAGLAAS